MQIKEKLMNQTRENDEKLSIGPNFGPFGPTFCPLSFFRGFFSLLDVRNCHKLSLYGISRKMYDPNSRKCRQTSFWSDLGPLGPTSGRQNCFSTPGFLSH